MTRFKSPGVINYGLSGSDVCAELRAVTMDMRGASINVASHLPRGTKEIVTDGS